MKNIKFSAWDKVSREVREVAAINWVEETVLLWAVRGSARGTAARSFDQIKLLLETHGSASQNALWPEEEEEDENERATDNLQHGSGAGHP